jgi:hypothetical protein
MEDVHVLSVPLFLDHECLCRRCGSGTRKKVERSLLVSFFRPLLSCVGLVWFGLVVIISTSVQIVCIKHVHGLHQHPNKARMEWYGMVWYGLMFTARIT